MRAIEYCIAHNHLRDFLLKCKVEVKTLLLSQGSIEEYLEGLEKDLRKEKEAEVKAEVEARVKAEIKAKDDELHARDDEISELKQTMKGLTREIKELKSRRME